MDNYSENKASFSIGSKLWDLFCVFSFVGIWPRFIEPKLLKTTHLDIFLPNLPADLQNLKIIQFSDLHLHSEVTSHYLKKIKNTIDRLEPDLILFTGDLLCHSKISTPDRLSRFLSSLKAPYGCFGVFGNHDYDKYVSKNIHGEYDIDSDKQLSCIRAFKRFFWQKKTPQAPLSYRLRAINRHPELMQLLSHTHFQFLENQTLQIKIKNSYLNICGLGDYSVGRCHPEEAFANYDSSYPGIVLSHNPDTIPHLLNYPGEIILCGHTHGAQVNLPFIWNKFTLLECPKYKRGALKEGLKTIYVNRGVGSTEPFRWFSTPEVLSITLRGQ